MYSCIAIVILTAVDAWRGAPAESLRATWTHADSEHSIEWIAAVGEPVDALVVANSGGGVDVLGCATGWRRNAASFRPMPGVRFVQLSDGDRSAPGDVGATTAPASAAGARSRAYLCNRFTVAGIDTACGAELWRIGDVPPRELLGGDPEFFGGIAAIAATERGVVVLGKDGELGLLDGATGGTIWRVSTEIGAEPVLCVHGDALIALSQTTTSSLAIRMDMRSNPPAIQRRAIDMIRPGFAAAWRRGVVFVSTDRIVWMDDRLGSAAIESNGEEFKPGSARWATTKAGDDVLLVQRSSGVIEAFAGGETRPIWRWDARVSSGASSLLPAREVEVVAAHREEVVIARDDEIIRLSLRTGRVITRERLAPPSLVIAADVQNNTLALIVRQRDSDVRPLRLLTRRIAPDDPPATSAPAESTSFREFVLDGESENPSAAEFHAGRLYIHEPHRVRAYDVPDVPVGVR